MPAVDINVPIGCGDAPVFPGDIVVGDGEGVIIIPAHMANDIAEEAHEMTAFEDFVEEEVMKGETIIGLYPATTTTAQKRPYSMAPVLAVFIATRSNFMVRLPSFLLVNVELS